MNEEILLKERLKSARAAHKVRTKDAADYLGVNPSVVSYMENTAGHNNRFNYLKFLRSKGIDLNKLFE